MTEHVPIINRNHSTPVWQQIRDILFADIKAGTFEPDGKLPSENQLAKRFSVNRHTVRQSLKALEEEGVTESRQGAGSFVVGRILNYPISKRTRFSEIVLQQGMTPSGEFLHHERCEANREVADALRIRKGTHIIQVKEISRADGNIVGCSYHHFVAGRFPNMADMIEQEGGISAAFRALGLENYSRQSTTISAGLPKSKDARLLMIPTSKPVLISRAINIDEKGYPIEYGVTYFNSDVVHMRFE